MSSPLRSCPRRVFVSLVVLLVGLAPTSTRPAIADVGYPSSVTLPTTGPTTGPATGEPTAGSIGSGTTAGPVASRPWTRQLVDLGVPVGSGTEEQRRSSCIARELIAGLGTGRSLLTSEQKAKLASSSLRVPVGAVEGLNVSVRCQMAYVIDGGSIVRILPVSTGRAGHSTKTGTHTVTRRWNGWHYSSLYPEAELYRTQYFAGAQAIHGLRSDRSVRPYPDSHGCIRVRHADADWLWKNMAIGDRVRVYGSW